MVGFGQEALMGTTDHLDRQTFNHVSTTCASQQGDSDVCGLLLPF